MSKADNLKDFLVDLANAIREKKNKTGAINPQDFSAEILSIIAGDVQMPNVSGTLVITEGITEDDYEALKLVLGSNITIDAQGGIYIHFEDPEVLRVLLANGVGDGTGITTEAAEKVTSIGTWFRGNTVITSFDELRKFRNVTAINTKGAFQGCTALKSIDLTNVKEVGGRYGYNGSAFLNCTSLSKVILGEGYTIGDSVFRYCSALAEIDLSKATAIRRFSFRECTSLKSIDLRNVEEMEVGEFVNCTSLAEVLNLDKVTSLNNTFEGCSSLCSPLSLPKLETIGAKTFYNCKMLPSVDSTNKVKSIGDNAFYGCSALTSINLSNVTSIGVSAFANCTALTNIGTLNEGITSLNNTFQNCALEIEDVSLPNLVIFTGEVFGGCKIKKFSNLGKITGWSTQNNNTYGTFGKKDYLEEVVLPDTVTEIGHYGFRAYTALKYIRANNIVKVGGVAFYSCTSLRELFPTDKITSWQSTIPESEYITFFHLPICTSVMDQIGRVNTTGITTAILPAVTTLGKYWMYNPTTTYIYLRDATSINEAGIQDRRAIYVIENETPANMTYIQAFGLYGDAHSKIYVPDSALQTYATATNWSTYYDNGQIKGISQLATDYPEFYAILKGTAEGYEDMAKWGYLADW